MKYRVIAKEIEFESKGLHTGVHSRAVLKPSNEPNIINFIVNGTKIQSNLINVVDTNRSTTLGKDSVKIQTVEHLLSVLYCLFIKNIDIYVDGKEIPALDGSAAAFVEKILSFGLKEIEQEVEFLEIKNSFKFEINNSKYEVVPSDKFIINCTLTTDKSEIINNQNIEIEINIDNFTKQIAYAKTFCYLDEVQKLQSKGYGLGGSLENVIVVDKNHILNPDVLTYNKDEFVRHKVLDFLGDLSLCNTYFKAKFIIKNPSHYTNIEFCRQLMSYINN